MILLAELGTTGSSYTVGTTILSLLLAFAIGQLIAWVYEWTHVGVSYSKSFTQSLVLMTLIVALVMQVIGSSIVTAFGLFGALAMIRFRNVLKDTRDAAFVFFALVLGLAVGSQRHSAAVVGAAFLILVVLYLHATSFGSRGHFDGHLTCWVSPGGDREDSPLSRELKRHCRRTKEMSCREGGPDGLKEYIYQVSLRDRMRHAEMVDSLRSLPDVGEVAFVLRDQLAEV